MRRNRVDLADAFGSAGRFPAWILAGAPVLAREESRARRRRRARARPRSRSLRASGDRSRSRSRNRSRSRSRSSSKTPRSRSASVPRAVRKVTPPSTSVIAEATAGLRQSYNDQQSPFIRDTYGQAMLKLAKRSAHHATLLAYKTKVTTDITRALTVQQVLQDMVVRGRTRWVGRGQFGAALLIQWKGIPVPMIMKVMGEKSFHKCLPGTAIIPPHMVCQDILPERRAFEWAPPFKPEWEQAHYGVLSNLSVEMSATPNLPFVFFAGYLELPKGMTVTIDSLIKDPANHVANTKAMDFERGSDAHVPVRRLSIIVMEYSGLNLDPLSDRVLRGGVSDAAAALIVRSVLCQVLHGLLAMRAVGMRHNDLHSNNVLGMPTPATHIMYVLEEVGEDGGEARVRVVRVPTLGMVWRIIDFGGSSVVEDESHTGQGSYRFGHGHMARFFYAGPTHPDVQDSRAMDVPLETFDLFRLATTLVAPRRDRTRSTAQTLLARMLMFGEALATSNAARRAYSIPVRKVAAMKQPRNWSLNDHRAAEKVLQEVVALSRASKDTGMLWEMFEWLVDDSGFNVDSDRGSQRERPTDDGPYFMYREVPSTLPEPAPRPTRRDVSYIVRTAQAFQRKPPARRTVVHSHSRSRSKRR